MPHLSGSFSDGGKLFFLRNPIRFYVFPSHLFTVFDFAWQLFSLVFSSQLWYELLENTVPVLLLHLHSITLVSY
jgi:hypothetical protein